MSRAYEVVDDGLTEALADEIKDKIETSAVLGLRKSDEDGIL